MTSFYLDSRLKDDSLPVGQLELCQIRLLNDARWPWLLLVPQRDNLEEIFDLDPKDQQLLASETTQTSRVLKALTGAIKINTGALGNIVRQLHIHVIARYPDDDNWPSPVWGFGQSQSYSGGNSTDFIRQLQSELDIGSI